MLGAAVSYVAVNVALLRTFASCYRLLCRLPPELWTATWAFSVDVPTSIRCEYEELMDRVRTMIIERSPPQRSAQDTMMLLGLQRVVWVVAATYQSFPLFVIAGLAQFVVAPYSFAVSVVISLMYFFTVCLGHLASVAVLWHMPLPSWQVELNLSFIVSFIILDLLANCYVSFVSCGGSLPKRFPWRETLKHVVWGTFNTKSYWLLVLLFCRGARFNLAWVLLDYLLGVGVYVNNLVQASSLSWEVMFYNAHRLGHLPVVYQQAHKMHHLLQDTLAFDGHVFSGSGFPEEWFQIFLDIAFVQLLGVPPPGLSLPVLRLSWNNKLGHQRKENDTTTGVQYHEDHHLFHRANFGFYRPLLDMYFGTYKDRSKDVLCGQGVFSMVDRHDGRVQLSMEVVAGKGARFKPEDWEQFPWWHEALRRTWMA